MDQKTVEDYILSLPNAVREYPFGEAVAVYKVGDKMFALMQEGKEPVQVSLKCDPGLSKILRDKYESVMPGYHLNKKHWNTIIVDGSLTAPQIKGFIRDSYQLVAPKK